MTRTVLLLACLLFAASEACATVAEDWNMPLVATASSTPLQITLQWVPPGTATSHTIYRRVWGNPLWGAAVASALPGATSTWTDTGVVAGTTYEYSIWSYRSDASTLAWGFAAGGIKVPLVDARGGVVLLVDSTIAAPLATEIARLQSDLNADGWKVYRHDVGRDNDDAIATDVVAIKALVLADRTADATVSHVMILGHVPVPYSGGGGGQGADGHPDHAGAWPADVYYGDLSGVYTDTTVNTTTTNQNVPGDGRFDQTPIPGSAAASPGTILAVGRVDLSRLPAFGALTEVDLLRRYLDKEHAWRNGEWNVPARTTIADSFGLVTGEDFACSGLRTTSVVGLGNAQFTGWFPLLNTQAHLFAYGCGSGGYQSCAGVGGTWDFASQHSYAVFTMLFGSYFGDWNVSDGLLRAPLANDGYGLTCVWAGRPAMANHRLALGATIGQNLLLTQEKKTVGVYSNGGYPNDGFSVLATSIALMGDPTLRAHPFAPPTSLAAVGGGDVSLAWTASTASGVSGYHVYRASSASGPFTRLTGVAVSTSQPDGAPNAATSYTDSGASSGTWHYLVKAVRLETTPGGSYINTSLGVAASATVVGGANHAPVANAQATSTNQDTAKAITLVASDADGDTLTWSIVASPAHGTLSGTAPNLTYTPAAGYAGADSFSFKVNDGTVDSNTATVSITVNAVNHAPVANAQSTSTNEDTAKAIALSASDADGNPLTWSIVAGPAHGTLSGTAPNLTYTPAGNWNGSDSFTFRVNDGTVNSNTATVAITVDPVNDVPVASAQAASTTVDTAKAIVLVASDADGDALSWSIVANPAHGTLSGSGANRTYTPDAGYLGADSFTFKVNDGGADSNTATVSINVSAVNHAPVANAQTPTTAEDTAAAITLTASDADGDGLNWSIIAAPAHGSLSGTAPALTYTPNANYHGSDAFTFRVNDGTVDSTTATVGITVTAVNDAPALDHALADQTGTTGVALSFTLPANAFSDADGDSLGWSVSGLPAGVSFNPATRTFSGTPTVAGTFAITVTVTDPSTTTASDSFDLAISAVNHAPQLATPIPDQAATVGSAFSYAIPAGTFTDADGDALTWSAGNLPDGLVFDSGSRLISGTPTTTGSPNVTISVSDGHGGSDSDVFRIVVGSPANDPPTRVGSLDDLQVQPGQIVAYAIPAGLFIDPDGDPITLAVSGLPGWLTFDAGTATISGTCPVAVGNWGASISHVVVTASDGNGASSSTSFTIVIVASVSAQRHHGNSGSSGCALGSAIGLLGAAFVLALRPRRRR